MNFSSILFYKPILKKIKPSELGYVRPDGTINFQSPESANRYAKNVVVKALNAEKPFERALLIDGSTIIKQVDGNEYQCAVKIPTYIRVDTMVHGHPDQYGKGNTTSFSPQDVKLLFKNPVWELEKLIVYNSKGESSTIVKEPYIPKMLLFLPEKKWVPFIAKKYKKFEKIIDKMSDEIQKQGAATAKKLILCGKDLQNFIKDIPLSHDPETNFTYLGGKINAITAHNILKKYAKKLGIKYETNFSNLD